MAKNNWYVITGGPSTGKTTLLAELEKLGHKTLPEAARLVIDRGIAKGQTTKQIRANEQKFQEEVARVKAEIEAAHPKDLLTFFDRGMHDTAAYMKVGAHQIEEWVQKLINSAAYQKVFLLDTLPVYEKDYARNEDDDQRLRLQELLAEAYRAAGMEVVNVPVMPPEERAKFVLSHVGAKVSA